MFHIFNPNKLRFTKIEDIFKYSLLDLGMKESSYQEAEYVFYIRSLGKYTSILDSNKKNILIQTEDWKVKPNSPKPGKYISFKNEKNYVWGFDILNPYEEYMYLGYHPKLDISKEKYEIFKNVGFLGSTKGRRSELHKFKKNKFESINDWDYLGAIRKMREYKINIHIHSYQGTTFTPWDRIVKMTSNNMFFITEECYLPKELDCVPMFNFENYDDVIFKYLKSEKMRRDISNQVYNIWKNKFDMRNFLERKIKEIK